MFQTRLGRSVTYHLIPKVPKTSAVDAAVGSPLEYISTAISRKIAGYLCPPFLVELKSCYCKPAYKAVIFARKSQILRALLIEWDHSILLNFDAFFSKCMWSKVPNVEMCKFKMFIAAFFLSYF